MLFDTLCDICEIHFPELIPVLSSATVIRMDIAAHEILDRQLAPDDMIDLRDEFQLPSPVVAVEDRGSCVVIADGDADVKGLFRTRLFIDCVPMDNMSPQNYVDGQEVLNRMKGISYPPGSCAIAMGSFHLRRHTIDHWDAGSQPTALFMGTRNLQILGPLRHEEIPPALIGDLCVSGLRNAVTAIEELISLRRSQWSITVELPTTFPKPPSIPRSSAREVMVPIKHELAAELFGSSTSREINGRMVHLIRRIRAQN
jgi:hypothetical protein